MGSTAGYNDSLQEHNPHETLASYVSYLGSYYQEIGLLQGNTLGGADSTCDNNLVVIIKSFASINS